MSVDLHILNAHGKLTPYLKQIKAAFSSATEQIIELMPVSGVDVVVYVDPQFVIPTLGIGGYSPAEDRVLIYVDPDNKAFTRSLETEFLTTLGHELHHCMRRRTVGYGKTLGEALVSEGLACHFELELSGKVPYYASALNENEIPELLVRAMKEFDNADYSYQAWFLAKGGELPFYAGYTLGYLLVSDFIEQYGKAASSLYAEPAEHFRK